MIETLRRVLADLKDRGAVPKTVKLRDGKVTLYFDAEVPVDAFKYLLFYGFRGLAERHAYRHDGVVGALRASQGALAAAGLPPTAPGRLEGLYGSPSA